MNLAELRKQIEYMLGAYFGIKSGAITVKEGTNYTVEEILKELQTDITRDVNYLSFKCTGSKPAEQDFKSICVHYRNKLMKQ